jgi:hypothetical protein
VGFLPIVKVGNRATSFDLIDLHGQPLPFSKETTKFSVLSLPSLRKRRRRKKHSRLGGR